MASTLAGARNTWNLMCGICKDVFRSPRILPCFHTFCLHCIEGLTRTHGHRFPCPQCRRTVQLPPEGPLGFQVNFYLDERQLELARKGPGNTICPIHSQDMEPLVFFCHQCDTALCIRCKLTKHEGHLTEDLSKAAKRCGKRLKDSKTQLEESIDSLTKKSKQAHEEAKAVKIKESAMEEQVIQHGAVLKARVDQAVKEVLEDLEKANNSTVQQAEAKACSIQKLLDSHTRQSQHVNRALEGADADRVCVEREMRDGAGNCENLKAAIDSVPKVTMMTVLRSYDYVSLGSIKKFIGTPKTKQFESQVQQETATLVVQLANDQPCRRIHSLFCLGHTIRASVGGMAPDYEDADIYIVNADGTGLPHHQSKIGKSSVQSYSGNKCFWVHCNSSNNFQILSKSHFCSEAKYYQKEGKCTISSLTPTLSVLTKRVDTHPSPIISIQSGPLIAFDAASDGKMFAVIVQSKKIGQPTTRKLHLLDSTCSQPVATYDPPGESFFPVDVCFWRIEDETKLLIADSQNDLVHVVNTADKQLQFERYLAPGSGLLVRPTTLTVDDERRVLIGCDNGKILRLDKVVRQE